MSAVPPMFISAQLPGSAVVEHAGSLHIVPLRPGGWAERTPYRGHRRALQPWVAGAEATLNTIGYQARSGEAARSGPTPPEAEREAKLISLRLPPDLLARFDAAAEQHGSRPRALAAALDALDDAGAPDPDEVEA